MVKKSLIILLAILLFGFILRFVQLNKLPLYGDELTMVYDSYSLFKTGKDQTGEAFPLTFKMGEGRPAGYVYFSIPFVAVFGPGVWGVRGLSVLSSLGIIVVMFLLVKKLFNQKVGLIASFMVAVSPWDLSLARGGFESHFALFLALSGIYFLFKVREKGFNFIIAIIFWGLAVNSYPTYKLILPILLPVVIWYLGGIKSFFPKNKLILSFSVIVVLGIITVTALQTFRSGSENRFMNINIFSSSQAEIEQEINLNRTITTRNKLFGQVFYNKPLSYLKLFATSYLKNFSPEYLFLSGDGQPRHNMTSSGVIYFVEIITIILGIKFLTDQKEKRKDLILITSWLLIAPLAAAFTLDNHGLRTNFMLPPLIIFSSLGIYYLLKNRKITVFLVLLFFWLIQFVFILQRLCFLNPNRFSRFWSNMAKVVALESYKERENYDYVILSSKIDNLEYAYQVYNKIEPDSVIKENNRKTKLGEYEFKKFDNVYIGSVPEGNLVSFLNLLDGKIKYYGTVLDLKVLEKYNSYSDLDGVLSVISYEKH